jgi:hypothetical protein
VGGKVGVKIATLPRAARQPNEKKKKKRYKHLIKFGEKISSTASASSFLAALNHACFKLKFTF